MSTIIIEQNYPHSETFKCRCDNCGEKFSSDKLAPIHDAEQRLTPGDETPAGECECGALAYVDEGRAS